jgi:hypothetical protein
MAKNDTDLFDRLRNAGLRKQVAKTLSGIGDDAGKRAVKAARTAISDLRALADEIENRLPGLTSAPARRTRRTSRRGSARSAAAAPRSSTRSATTGRRSAGASSRRSSGARTASRSSARKTAPARSSAAGGRAPRGANKAKILASLKSGPKTASEIAKQTGIGVGTVGSTLTKMAGSGEVQKAARGYALPK